MSILNSTNQLPDLTRKLNKREASISPRILEWFHTKYPYSWFIEIKATKTNTIPLSAVKPHQLKALIDCQSPTGFKHKMSDIGRIRQPFDAFGAKNAHAFVVCAFLSHHLCFAFDPSTWHGASINSKDQIFSIPLWSKA